jgi:vesicle coat complex subunit
MSQKQGKWCYWALSFKNGQNFSTFHSRASMIWIIGEYAERIDNADELLESFLDSFQDENTQVQLQLLTAIVKLFLKRPADTQELVQQVFY